MNVELIKILESKRIARGYTKYEMANKLHIAPTHYSEFIHKKRKLPFNSLKYAFLMGVPAHILLK